MAIKPKLQSRMVIVSEGGRTRGARHSGLEIMATNRQRGV